MPRGKKVSSEQIIAKLREAEVDLAQRKTFPQVCKTHGIAEQTYYRWKKDFGGLCHDEA